MKPKRQSRRSVSMSGPMYAAIRAFCDERGYVLSSFVEAAASERIALLRSLPPECQPPVIDLPVRATRREQHRSVLAANLACDPPRPAREVMRYRRGEERIW